MIHQKINRVLISVYSKEGLSELITFLGKGGVEFISTGGTQQFIEQNGYPVTPVENITGYPTVFGGRVKTLHPAIFGGLLFRRDHTQDQEEAQQYGITPIDMAIVDLYPAEQAIAKKEGRAAIVEKIDIGGVSLIRAAAKNYQDVLIVSDKKQYSEVIDILRKKNLATDLEDRERFAAMAFETTARYDTAIAQHFIAGSANSSNPITPLRYGENPHQKGVFHGNLENLFNRLDSNTLSYNNLVDIDAAVRLMEEFTELPTFAIIKHTNVCGIAEADSIAKAYKLALACDPTSAFGGVLVANRCIDRETAALVHELFFEALVAPEYDTEALKILKAKKNRRLLQQTHPLPTKPLVKTVLNGLLEQDIDLAVGGKTSMEAITKRAPSPQEAEALLFANKIVKHAKSNAIVLATNHQLLGSGVGQTSRVDALRQAIEKAKRYNFDLNQAVIASDAFFPFSDCVEICHQNGIKAIIQPGGSIRDQESIDYCNQHDMAMVMTGIRHFRH